MMVTTGFYNVYGNTQQKRKKALIFCTKKIPKGIPDYEVISSGIYSYYFKFPKSCFSKSPLLLTGVILLTVPFRHIFSDYFTWKKS